MMSLLVGWLLGLTINNVAPTVINSADDTVTVGASYSGTTTAQQYLQVVFNKEGQSPVRYFGLTQNLDGAWYQYKSLPTLADLSGYFYRFIPVNASWSGQLTAKIDMNSEWYKGSGNYLLKLFRHVTAGGIESDNNVLVTINVPLPVSDQTTTSANSLTLVAPAPSPAINLSLPADAVLGQGFKLTITLNNFSANTEYYLKLRGGPDEDHLTKVQTKNGGAFLADNESWSGFPLIKTNDGGVWTGEVWGQIGEDKPGGKYKLKLRARRKEAETFYESEIKELLFNKPVVLEEKPKATAAVEVLATSSGNVLATQTAQLRNKVFSGNSGGQKESQQNDFVGPIFIGSGVILLAASVVGAKWRWLWSIIQELHK